VDINEDPRYKLANKEAFYSLLLTLLYFFWWYGFCLWVGFKARNKLLIYYGISKLVFLELYHGVCGVFLSPPGPW